MVWIWVFRQLEATRQMNKRIIVYQYYYFLFTIKMYGFNFYFFEKKNLLPVHISVWTLKVPRLGN